MSFSVEASRAMPSSINAGPFKMQVLRFSVSAGETTGAFIASGLFYVYEVSVSGLKLEAHPVIEDNVVSLSFSDPEQDLSGLIVCYGR